MNWFAAAAFRNPSENDPHICLKNAPVAAREECTAENKTAKPMSHAVDVSADAGGRDKLKSMEMHGLATHHGEPCLRVIAEGELESLASRTGITSKP